MKMPTNVSDLVRGKTAASLLLPCSCSQSHAVCLVSVHGGTQCTASAALAQAWKVW